MIDTEEEAISSEYIVGYAKFWAMKPEPGEDERQFNTRLRDSYEYLKKIKARLEDLKK